MTVHEILTAIFRVLGVINPTAGEYDDGMESINLWLAELGLTMTGLTRLVRENFNTVAGTASYTIGTSQTFNTSRPQEIAESFVRISSTDYPVRTYNSMQDYARIPDKTLQSRPTRLFYERAASTGTIFLYPVPDAVYDLHLWSVKPFTAYTSTGDSLGLAPEFEPAIKWNVAIELAPEFGMAVPETVYRSADRTLTALMRAHAQPVKAMRTDPMREGGADYDITGDTYL